MRKFLAAVALLALTACAPGLSGKNKVPDPKPDHAAPTYLTSPYRVDFAVFGQNVDGDSFPLKYDITVHGVERDGKPTVLIADDGVTDTLLAFQMYTDGLLTVTYTPNTISLTVDVDVYGTGGDNADLEVNDVKTDTALRPMIGALTYCVIPEHVVKGSCRLQATVVVGS